MMRFETDLQVVRASPADREIGLTVSASRWALAEAAIVADMAPTTHVPGSDSSGQRGRRHKTPLDIELHDMRTEWTIVETKRCLACV